MSETDVEDGVPEGDELPSYDTPGRILVHLLGPGPSIHDRYETEVMDYDANTAVFWIEQGTGIDWWIDRHITFPSLDEGYWVVEGITGIYVRGDWDREDEEEWEFASLRPATDAEIESGALGPSQSFPSG